MQNFQMQEEDMSKSKLGLLDVLYASFVRFRILPAMVVLLAFSITVKVLDLVRGDNIFSEKLLVTSAIAQDEVEAQKAEEQNQQENQDNVAGEQNSAEVEQATDGAKKDSFKDILEPVSDAEVSKGGLLEEKPEDLLTKQQFNAHELSVLQNLTSRRLELEQMERDLVMKENMLKATEQKIDTKITQMKELDVEIQKRLAMYNENEAMKIRSLVKIYESMKPKDAAQIFQELDMNVLLSVVDKMSEKKAAPILAAMDPKRAKAITIELANQKSLPEPALVE